MLKVLIKHCNKGLFYEGIIVKIPFLV